MKTRILFSFLFLLFLFKNGEAQYNDFGSWNSLSIEKKIAKKVKIGITGQIRLNENATQVKTFFSDIDLSYGLLEDSKIFFSYRFGEKRHLDGYYLLSQRYSLGFSTKRQFEDWKLSYRFKGQWTNNNIEFSDYKLDFSTGFRNKIAIQRKLIKKTTGWTSFELFSNKNEEQFFYISDWRWKLGVDRKIKKRQYLSLGFMVQQELQAYNPATEFVVLLGYEIELKKSKKKKSSSEPKDELIN